MYWIILFLLHHLPFGKLDPLDTQGYCYNRVVGRVVFGSTIDDLNQWVWVEVFHWGWAWPQLIRDRSTVDPYGDYL